MLARLKAWLRTNPLLVLALVAAVGICAADAGWTHGSGLWLPSIAGLLLVAAFLSGRAWLLPPACALVFAFIHEARTDETFRHPLRTILQRADKPQPAVMRGRLLPDFDTTEDGRAHAVCVTEQVKIAALGWSTTRAATLLVRLPKGVRFPGAGVFELRGDVYLPRASSNPGAFDAQEFALRNGRVARFDAEGLRRIDSSGGAWWCAFLQAAEHCRRWISAQLTMNLEDDPETAAVIRAMALGVSAEADDEIEDAFRNSGTLHVFAVSGLHVGLLGVIALVFLRQLGMRRGLSLWVTVGLVFAYAFITGWRPSAARAAFMVAVFMGAPLLDRESSLQNSLGAAALILLGSDTHQIFMPGFQLSFVVLWLSVIGSMPLVARLLPLTQLDPFLPPQLANWRQRAWSQFRRWLAATVSVSFAAWLGSLPFILGHFQAVTPVAVIANCVLVPLSFLCLGATCLSLCAAALHLTGVQIIFNNANWALAKAMTASAAWFAGLPGASFHFQPNAPPTNAPIVWRVMELPHGGAANHLRIGNTHWLLDTGDESSFRRVLRPSLHSSGVNAVNGVFLSHNDADHIGAILQVGATFHPNLVFCSTQEPGGQDSSLTTIRRLLATPGAPPLRKLAVDERVTLAEHGGLKCEAQVLYPSRQVQNARGDDRAMVLMVRAGPWRLLWMSDAGWNAEKSLCSSAADLRCDVLIRSQHEHDLAMTTEFLLKAMPRVIVCGSDARDPEVTLPASLIEFAKQHDITVLDTWSDGSVELRFMPEEMDVVTKSHSNQIVLSPHG
ncbi:MAG: ComEC/Rec2 family competence protein [Verrucomicrobiaceae bacterium]